jgi:hypothetical protein
LVTFVVAEERALNRAATVSTVTTAGEAEGRLMRRRRRGRRRGRMRGERRARGDMAGLNGV